MKTDNIIRCLVLDDEPLAVNLLAEYINKTDEMTLVMKTTNPEEALKKVQSGDVDIIFLDIQMPRMNGIEIMEIIRNNCRVILTTAYPQYALEGFEHDVIDYLLKPIDYERFIIAADKAKQRLGNCKEIGDEALYHIFIKSGHRLQRIELDTIFYIEALRDYIAFHTKQGKILSLESMKNIEGILPSTDFIRIHKSFIVNKTKIEFLEKWKVVINNQYLPVGETYRDRLASALKTL